ncbi:P-loop ATPase, Sll1717 family [Enterococcus larvae]|uniref:P-loop ATPase, Sll1717 family n=1 Tax=Enterococcus larvae TaxID=2794352 RepID=UPI003F407F40
MLNDFRFDEDTIAVMFGHEAAEDEDRRRLMEYYVKSDVYSTMRSNRKLLILVGHKGVGKSALLNIMEEEDKENNIVSLKIQPDDVLQIDMSKEVFLRKISIWKEGLSSLLVKEMINESLSFVKKFSDEDSGFSKILDVSKKIFGKKIEGFQEEHIGFSSKDFISLIDQLGFKDEKIMIYLDDLDRGWKNSKDDIENLSAMLNAIRDLSRELNNVHFRISLRSDIYYSVRTSDETTDKIDGSVVWQSWTNHQILVMLIKRIETYFNRNVNENELLSKSQDELSGYLTQVFEPRFNGKGHWKNAPIYRVIMSLIRKRPRDMIKLCTLAARSSNNNNHSKIMTVDLESNFRNYSNDRLMDTSTEYQAEFSNVRDLLLKMKPSKNELKKGNPSLFNREELIKKIENVLSMSSYYFSNGDEVTAERVAAFLYKINFITARKILANGEIQRVYYDENQYIYNQFTDFGYSYEIHPAYRWALQPDSIDNLFNEIELYDEAQKN